MQPRPVLVFLAVKELCYGKGFGLFLYIDGVQKGMHTKPGAYLPVLDHRTVCRHVHSRNEKIHSLAQGIVNCITSMPLLAAFSSRLVLLAALAVCARRQRCRALLVCCELLPCPLLRLANSELLRTAAGRRKNQR